MVQKADAPKKKPRIDILERRLQNPHGEPSTPIEMKDGTMECRIFNKAVKPQQIWLAQQKGWEFVTPDQLKDIEQAGGFAVSTDGTRMVRGPREEEVIMYMPKDYRKKIEAAKAKRNVADMAMGKQKEAVAQAAAQQFGDQAGDFISKTRMVGNVTDSYERIHAQPETE